GNLSGQNISVLWDLYRDPLSFGGDGFSGYVSGSWVDGPINTSSNVALRPGRFEGVIFGEEANPTFPGQVGNAYNLVGQRAAAGQPFQLQVTYTRNGQSVTGTLTALQL